MTEINRSEVIEKLVKGLRLHPSRDKIPTKLASSIVPVFEVAEENNINVFEKASTSASGSSTIYTTPTDKDFYLCGAALIYSKDNSCDNTLNYISCTLENGKTALIVQTLQHSLVEEKDKVYIDYNKPLLLKRGSTITLNGTFTAGSMNRRAMIWGYTKQID